MPNEINPSPMTPSSVPVSEQTARTGLLERKGFWKGSSQTKRHTVSRVKPEYTLIAKGADKQVFEAKNLNDRKVVVYIPVRKFCGLYSRESALKQEYQKTQEIKRPVSDFTHLAVDMKRLTGQDRIDDQFSLETTKAAGDLEATIQNTATTFGQRLDYCAQYLDGLMNLHGADMAHGDIKPENCLIYDDGSLKIADFGKIEKLPDNKTRMYKGNLRFCPPEGVLSIKGDVYGSALLIIRALEEAGNVLDDNGCLLPIPEEDREPGVTGMGRGIDKYVVERKEFLAIDSQNLAGKITKRLPRQIKLAHQPKKQQKEQRKLIVYYIKTLVNKLHNQGYLTEKSAENLTQLLIDMTTRNPSLRITAREAFSRFKALQNDVGIEKMCIRDRAREEIRREMILNRVRQRQVAQRVQVSEQEIDNFLSSPEGLSKMQTEYRLAHILIATPDNATPDQVQGAERHANELSSQLRQGADFQALAIANSKGQNALEGGDLGWRKADQLPTLFAEQAIKMSKGQTSAPIRSPAGFHIFKLMDTRGNEKVVQSQVHVRHILIKPNEIRSNLESQMQAKKLYQRVQAGEEFSELAKAYSDDTASALNGGDMGWISPDALVPEFQTVMNIIPQKVVSEPFRTTYGWHILEVLGKRQSDISTQVRRNQVRELLSNRKFEEELQVWLREVRDQTYVEIQL